MEDEVQGKKKREKKQLKVNYGPRRKKCIDENCTGTMGCNKHECPECGLNQGRKGKSAIDYKPLGKTCSTTEKYKIHGRLMGLEEQHHLHGIVLYLAKKKNGFSIDHSEEGGFFNWFLNKDEQGKNFVQYLKSRFVEWCRSEQTGTNKERTEDINNDETDDINNNQTDNMTNNQIDDTNNDRIDDTNNDQIDDTNNGRTDDTNNDRTDDTNNDRNDDTNNDRTDDINNDRTDNMNNDEIDEITNDQNDDPNNEQTDLTININRTGGMSNDVSNLENETKGPAKDITIKETNEKINDTLNNKNSDRTKDMHGFETKKEDTRKKHTRQTSIAKRKKKAGAEKEEPIKKYPKRKNKVRKDEIEKVEVEVEVEASVCDRKSLVGKCVGLYTDNPQEYWVFCVEKVSTKGVHGKFYECFDRENRLYRHHSDGQDNFYESIIRRGVEKNDFFYFQLEKSEGGYQVPFTDHLALVSRLEECAQHSL